MERQEKVDISVQVLTYYHENYIAQCLDSILAQETELRYEILVGDDASQDRTPEIIREYAARYPDIIFPTLRKENLGASRNSAELLEHARGRYLAILEGDDFWLDRHKLQKQWDFLEAHPEYSACCGKCLIVDEAGQADYTQVPHFVWNKKVFTLDDLIESWNVPGQAGTMMHRRFTQVDPALNHIHRNVGDKTGVLFLLSKGPIYCSGEVLSAYRRVDRSDGHNWFSIHHSNPYRNYDMFMYPCKLETWARKNMGLPRDKHFGKRSEYRFCRFVEELVRQPSWTRVKYLAEMVAGSHQPVKYGWMTLKALIEME